MLLLLPGLPHSFAGGANPPSRNTSAQGVPALSVGGIYHQTNLVSNLPGVALIEDPQLSMPWGVALNANSPFWVVNKGNDRATLYKGDVSGSPLVVNSALPSVGIPNVPTLVPFPSRPTGVVANTTSDFLVSLTPTSPAAPAHFIFATLSGGINAWQPGLGSVAVVVKFMSGHSYTGLALGSNASGNLLYAADFANGKIDVFDKEFNQTSVSGNFTDASIPANHHPYNIQNLGGSLYVTYAPASFPLNFDQGFVRKFDTNGVRDNGFTINNGPLFSPWGMALAPANFGAFSNALLVGNNQLGGVNSSSINAFNPSTGAVLGRMVDGGGASLQISDLRALVFGTGVNAGDPNTLYFAAGSSFSHFELFGSLKPIIGVPASTIQFSDRQYFTQENAGHIDVAVTRSGVVSGTATVNYATVDVGATQKSDYEIAVGKLTFNPGETSKTFRVLIVDDKAYAGGSSVDLNLVLSNATGAELTSPTYSYLYIMDDEGDTPGQPPNILDDTQFFVRQQYFDFLNREPDAAGFNFWVNQITSCGTDQQCIEVKRINVSAAFFLSIEFQSTGMLAYLTEKAALGGLPRYGSFMRDVQALQKDYVFGAPGADVQLEANKQAFFDEFVTRPQFVANYAGLSNRDYVFALFSNAALNTTTGELYIARLNGAQVVPPTASTATGLVIVRQKINPRQVSISLSFSGLSSAETDAHLHGPAAADSNGGIILALPAGNFVNFEAQLSSAQLLDLSGGLVYADVHTTNFPNGEIRGQLPHNLFVTDMLIRSLDAGIITRAQALRLVAESEYFRLEELNRAFVLMEYFGYLRRNPSDPPDNNLTGFNFWLDKLNSFNGDYVRSEMVKAFISSKEYRSRFGPP
ncbi:MAG TPA: TIGR03118 family protein [Pyrinomonadaceae bacterium]|nr:TIGR03118 family protein [Pyrinomonadaceae bacterium]